MPFAYNTVPWTDPVELNGALRLIVDGTFAGITVSGLTGVTGTPTVGAYVKFAGTATTTGVATALIQMPVPSLKDGQPVYLQDFLFSGAKVAGTGTGVVAGTDTWVTGIGLYEAVATAASTTIAITSALYLDTTNRLTSTQSATPTDFSFTDLNLQRTAGTKLYLGIQMDCNDEALDFRFYMGDHGYIRYSNRPLFLLT